MATIPELIEEIREGRHGGDKVVRLNNHYPTRKELIEVLEDINKKIPEVVIGLNEYSHSEKMLFKIILDTIG